MTSFKLILWDLDGTLYPESNSIQESFKSAVAEGVREVVDPNLTDDEVHEKIKESRALYGDSFSGLIKEGHDPHALHEAHHNHLDHTLIERNDDLIKALKQIEGHNIKHAILTHGHFDWTQRVLKQVGIDQFFDKNDIISVEQIGFIKKHTGQDAFDAALKRTGFNASEVIMVEDKKTNLIHPHEMGMHTILLNYHREHINPCPDYINQQLKSAEEVSSYVSSLLKPKPPSYPESSPS